MHDRKRRGGGFATEVIAGLASGVAASQTASVRQALTTGPEAWQRLADGYRSAHQGKAFSGLPMNVLPGVLHRKLCFCHR